jgi:hypothetical protein
MRMASRATLCGRLALAVGITIAAAAPLRAQCRLCDTPTTDALSLGPSKSEIALNVEASLDFDRLVLFGMSGGSATLMPSGERSASGGVAAISGRAMVGAVTVRGEPGRAVRVDLPGRLRLYSLSGGSITIDQIGSDLPRLPKLDSTGNLSFRFGGRLWIDGDAEGDYRGDVPITVEYL